MDNILKKAGPKKSEIIYYGVGMAVLIIAGIYFISSGFTMENYFGRNDGLKSMLTFMGFVLIALAVVFLLRLNTALKMFVCVCTDKVYGVAGKSLLLATESFEFKTEDITNVSLGANLVIESRSKICILRVEDSKEVYNLIQKQTGIKK